MCAFFGPKNGDFQKMLRIVWNGKKCNKIEKKKLFLGGIIYWYWIVSFLVLNILGIMNKNNLIMLRSLGTIISWETRENAKSLWLECCQQFWNKISLDPTGIEGKVEGCSSKSHWNGVWSRTNEIFETVV